MERGVNKNFRENMMIDCINEILEEKEEYNNTLKQIRNKLKEILDNKISFDCFEDYLKRSRGLLNYEQKVLGFIDKCDGRISEIKDLIDYDRVNDGRNVYYHLVRYRNKKYGIVVSYGDRLESERKILRLMGMSVTIARIKSSFMDKIRDGKMAFYKTHDSLPNEAWETMKKLNIEKTFDKE